MPKQSDRTVARGRWYLPATALFVGLLVLAPEPATAQKAVPTEVVPARPISPPLPTGPLNLDVPRLTPLPVPIVPNVVPATPQPVAPAPATAAPAPIIRLRCEVAPGDTTCREAPVPDGGGDGDACDCARDLCYNDAAGRRICEKP